MKLMSRRCQLESLESRNMLTVAAELVADIREGQRDSQAGGFGAEFFEYKGELYFSADDGKIGRELWKSDGTEAGTQLVKDIHPGTDEDSSTPGWFVELNGELYFTASDENVGDELWKTDGTAEGTVLLKDINPGDEGSFASDLVFFNNEIYFPADNGQVDSELWKSDGTGSGTQLVRDIRAGDGSSDPGLGGGFYEFNGHLYFDAEDTPTGVELWRTDGTTTGTELVIDASPGDADSWPHDFVEFQGDLFFIAEVETAASFQSHLFRVDGATGEAKQATNIPIDLNAGLLTTPDHLYFSGLSDAFGWELFKSDGTNEGTSLVRDIMLGTGTSSPSNFFEHEGRVYFSAGDASDPESQRAIPNLWYTDGTLLGTKKVSSERINPANPFVAYDGSVFYTALSEELGWELFKTNGTVEGTEVVHDVNNGEADSFAIAKTVFEDRLLFLAQEPSSGWEIWVYDGASTDMIEVHLGGGDFTDEPALFQFVEFGNDLVFYGGTPFEGKELFIIRGSEQLERLDGDANEDGTVDFLDFLALANNFGKNDAIWADGDFDGNGSVDFLDFLTLANNFGATAAEPVVAAAEPSDEASAAAVESHDGNDDRDVIDELSSLE